MGLLFRLMAWLLFKAFRLAFGMFLLSCLVLYVAHRFTSGGGGQPARPASAPTQSAPESAVPPAGEGSLADGVPAAREGWSAADYEAAVRSAGAYSPEGRRLQAEQGILVQRGRWDRHVESIASGGATDEEVALAREAAERNLAQMAAQGELSVQRARNGLFWTPPPPDPVERKRESIAENRRKREASWDRWMARQEASGMSADRLAQERAWVERRKAEDRAREDRELAELEERMRRRRGGGALPPAEGPEYNP